MEIRRLGTLPVGSPNLESRAVSADGGLLAVRTRDVVGFGPDGEIKWQIFGYPNGNPPTTPPTLAAIRLGQPIPDRDGRVQFTFHNELVRVQTSMTLATTRWPLARGSVRQAATLQPPHGEVLLRFAEAPVFADGAFHVDLEIDAEVRDGVEL